jgi:(1->4)-alpha-D-glucan 1-alpha-D-glucosylmutase
MIDPTELASRATTALSKERRATYRLQLGPGLGFEQVAALAPYLAVLGVSDVYLSPCFQCAPGSSHGYDVTDYNSFNRELGTAESFDRMAAAVAAEGLGLILDVVPNHMGIGADANAWWRDVMENGPSSPYAAFFDIDWAPVKVELENKVLLPVLPDQYGAVLERQDIQLELVDGAFWIRCPGGRLPIDPSSYAQILASDHAELTERLGAEHPQMSELSSIITAIEHLPGRTDTDRVEERRREKEIIKRRLAALLADSPEIGKWIEETVRAINGLPGDPASFDRLDVLLSAQTYRLADWRVAGDEVNYRRFFDVSDLAAIRMERPEVFEACHALVLSLIGTGAVTGLRVDHPDGLYAPGEYFRRLQESALIRVARRIESSLDAEGEAALAAHYRSALAERLSSGARPLWIAAEKILAPEEPLPDWWPVAGTTGYDFLSSVNGLFVDRKAWRQMTAVYTRFVGAVPPMADLAYAGKRLIMQVSMASEINQLGRLLDRISEQSRHSRDFTLPSLVRALREVIACFPVYRTYVGDKGCQVSARDRDYVERAVAEAKRRNPTVNASVFDFVRDTLLLRDPSWVGAEQRAERCRFAMRFQQTSGPVAAKGVEDTALYRYHRLVSLNEVGSDPALWGAPVATFHERNAQRLHRWPESLLCTGTHDTKRGEDARARIDVLSEIPGPWAVHVRRWRMMCRRWKTPVDGRPAPDRNDEYLLYQTLIGAWPAEPAEIDRAAFAARIGQYMDKAVKEAKEHTSWVNPNPAYDAAVRDFVAKLCAVGSPFVDAFQPFARQVARYGAVNSLAQTLLKVTSPGIPDFYQGSELWDLNLVDPDNRREVDFARRRALLNSLTRISGGLNDRSGLCRELWESWPDGRVKLYLTQRALGFRRQYPHLFAGGYAALTTLGECADHVIGFARAHDREVAVVAVPRLLARLTGFSDELALGRAAWGKTWLCLGDTSLAGVYRDCFSGRTLSTEIRDGLPVLAAGALFDAFPVALLAREGGAR